MLKRVEEDWSFFNRAVCEKAEGRSRQEVPPLKLVTPGPSPAPSKPAPLVPPPPPPVQPPSATAAPPMRPLGAQPSDMGRGIAFIAKLLLGIAAIVVLGIVVEAAWRTAHPPGPAATGAGPGAAEKVVTDYTMFNTVAYRSWKVVTGWKFASSRAARPSLQYCHLEAPTPDGQRTYTIEERGPGERHDMPKALVPGLDKAAWDQAATKCVWHR